MRVPSRLLAGVLTVMLCGISGALAQKTYPFQNPRPPVEQRINNILSLMTLQQKIACLGTNPSVPRLGIHASGQVEGLHGLAMGGPAGWGFGLPMRTWPAIRAGGARKRPAAATWRCHEQSGHPLPAIDARPQRPTPGSPKHVVCALGWSGSGQQVRCGRTATIQVTGE